MPIVHANDLEIAYDVVGSGPPLVLLHGASTSGRGDVRPASSPRSPRRSRVYLPDARGHGGTRWDAGGRVRGGAGWSTTSRRFVDALGLGDVPPGRATRWAAMTALGFAARAPERVRTLVAVGITVAREPRASVGLRLMDPVRILRDDPAWAAELDRTIDRTQGPGAWRRLLPAIAADIAVQPLLTPAELRAIAAPTLIACGDHDPLVPVGQAWELSRQVRHGSLFVAPDSGHDVLTRRPALALEAMRGFYRSTEAIAVARAEGSPEVRP